MAFLKLTDFESSPPITLIVNTDHIARVTYGGSNGSSWLALPGNVNQRVAESPDTVRTLIELAGIDVITVEDIPEDPPEE